MTTRETVYLGHDNSIDIILTEDDQVQNLSAATQMTVTLGAVTITSDNGAADPIRWNKSGYVAGEVRIFLGHQAVTAGYYEAPLVVYDEVNTEGVVWTVIPIDVKPEVENA